MNRLWIFLVALLLVLLGTKSFGETLSNPESSSQALCEPYKNDSNFGLGPSVFWILPGINPDLAGAYTTYGAIGRFRLVSPIHLYLQGLYGSESNQTAISLIDGGLKFQLTDVYLNFFASLGIHQFHLTTPAYSTSEIKWNLGIGLAVRLSQSVDVPLEIKLYFQQQLMVGLGGNLLILF